MTGRAAVLACVAAIALTSCTSGADSGGSSAGGTTATRGDTSAESAESDGMDAARPTAQPVSGLPPDALADRAIERRGSLELRSDKVGDTRDKVVAAADRAGGYVATENSTTDSGGGLSRTDLRVVVPTETFDSTMTAITNTGKVVSREQSAEDVTDKMVDVDSRLKSARSSLSRVRLLLDRATSLGEVIRLETVIGRRQADLEALQARQESLASRTSTATIDVTVRVTSPEPAPTTEADDEGFVAGLSAGWDGLMTVGTGLLTGFGAVLPFLLALGIPVAAVALLVRRLLRRRTAAAA